jgi:N6-L-threonylcarbamoyladenine synthase
VVRRALANAGVAEHELTAVAVTVGPGLVMCLRVGVTKAQSICAVHDIPIIPVHHMEAHALVARVGSGRDRWMDGHTEDENRNRNRDGTQTDGDRNRNRDGTTSTRSSEESNGDGTSMEDTESAPTASFPFLALLVSGGHNQLLLATNVGEYKILGTTLDDALGEAYDKTARLLGLDVGGGGGPALEQLARKGNPKAYRFPIPLRKRKDCDFSYAGLKTAVRLAIERDLGKGNTDAFSKVQGGGLAETDTDREHDASRETIETNPFSPEELAERNQIKADIAASFQFAAVTHLEERTRRAVGWARESLREQAESRSQSESHPDISCLVVAGGVAANEVVRKTLASVAKEAGVPLVTPPQRWCTDNGVMVAWAGVERWRLGLAEEAPTLSQIAEPEVVDPSSDKKQLRRDVPLLPRWPLGLKDARATGDVKSSKTAKVAPPLRGARR